MKSAFIHASTDQSAPSGVTRYGRLPAQAFVSEGMEVVNTDFIFTENQRRNSEALRNCCRNVKLANVLLIQYSPVVWGKISISALFLAPWNQGKLPLILTVHDSQYLDYPRQPSQAFRNIRALGIRTTLGELRRLLAALLKFLLVSAKAKILVVHSATEIEKLSYVPSSRRKIRVIPHFVESREHELPTKQFARQKLGLEGRLVICLLGFIFPRKGHDVLLRAATVLAPNALIVFAGGPVAGGENYVAGRVKLAEALGIGDQVRITGYLADDDQAMYLAATDIAVLPFHQMAASGSLSTWLAAEHPMILANNLPQIAEYNAIAPGAILTFVPFTPDALGAELLRLSASLSTTRSNSSIRFLRDQLSMPNTVSRYMQVQ